MKLSDLTLPELDITNPAFGEDPFAHYRTAVQQHWLAKASIGYVVLRHQDIRALLLMDDKLDTPIKTIVTLMGTQTGAWARWNASFLLATSDENHKRIRELIAPAFTPRAAEAHRPIIKQAFTELLEQWAARGKFDFAEFAAHFPVAILCRLIGVPAEAVPEIAHKLEVLGAGFSMKPDVLAGLNEAIEYMLRLVDGAISERELRPSRDGQSEDFLDQLRKATQRENGFSRQELCDLIVQLFGSAYHTSKNLLILIVNILLDRPADWQRLARDEAFAKSVTNEGLRHASIITLYRIARAEFEFKGVTIPKGTMLVLPLPFAARDEAVFGNADSFDPERKPEANHLAFGSGMHTCVGQFMARVQTEVALPIMASRLPELSRDGAIAWRPFLAVRGLTSLPVNTGEQA